MVLLWCADVQRDSIERFIYESGIASTKVVEQGSTNMSTTKVDKGPRIGPQTKVHEQRSTNKGPRSKGPRAFSGRERNNPQNIQRMNISPNISVGGDN